MAQGALLQAGASGAEGAGAGVEKLGWLRSETSQMCPLSLRNVGAVQPVLGPGCSSPGVPVISKNHEESRGTHQQPLLGPRQLDSVTLLTMGVRRQPLGAERESCE